MLESFVQNFKPSTSTVFKLQGFELCSAGTYGDLAVTSRHAMPVSTALYISLW